jgi:hypothetical protein
LMCGVHGGIDIWFGAELEVSLESFRGQRDGHFYTAMGPSF